MALRDADEEIARVGVATGRVVDAREIDPGEDPLLRELRHERRFTGPRLLRATNSLKVGVANGSSHAPVATSAFFRYSAFARHCLATAMKPCLPRRHVRIVIASAQSAWFVQMLLVARSRRMCCSRVESVSV